MDDETRAAFARMDRWFELGQAQHQELRHEMKDLRHEMTDLRQEMTDLRQEMKRLHHGLRQEMDELREQIARLDAGLTALYAEFRTFRDWVTVQFAELRGMIQQLTLRVERVERRQNDPIG